jgi:hypothetical protein
MLKSFIAGLAVYLFVGLGQTWAMSCKVFVAGAVSKKAAAAARAKIDRLRESLRNELEVVQPEPGTYVQVNERWQNLRIERAESLELYDRAMRAARTPLIIGELDVLNLLSNPEMTYYHSRLKSALKSALADKSTKSMNQKILAALKRSLKNAVPKDSIDERIESFQKNEKDSLLRVLGQMDLKELQTLVYGTNLRNPSPDSLLGQYLSSTGATTSMRAFPKGPRRSDGEPKLVVSLSQRSFAKYKALFSTINYLIHVHSPQQGTLYVAHEGMSGSYANLQSEIRAPSPGALLPHILLTTSEGQRARLFFALGSQSSEAREPWDLENYCAKGGYSSCTHWFGNIPVGDKLVEGYTFPGKVDEHAYNNVPRTPRYRQLREYVSDNPLMKLVWKVPGHEQLADVLGLQRANTSGEFANPGWVAYNLIGAADVDRVPIVFLTVGNHRKPIPRDFDLQISAY